MSKTLKPSSQTYLSQPQAADIELVRFAPAASPQSRGASKTLSDKSSRAENEAATVSKLVAGLPPDTMLAMASVSHAWRDGVLNSSRWQGYAEIAAQLPAHKTDKRTPPPTQEVILKRSRRIGLMACVTGIVAAVAVGTGFGLATGLNLAAANRHACDAYAALPVQIFSYNTGNNYYLTGGITEFVGNYTVDARAVCESGASYKATPFPAGFSNARYIIEPTYISPTTHQSFSFSQYAMVIGASLGTLMVFSGAGLALRNLNRARMSQQLRDLEAGIGTEQDLVASVLDARDITPGNVVARHAKLLTLEPMLQEAIASGHAQVIKQFGTLFKRLDSLDNRKIHQELFLSAIEQGCSPIVQTLLAQGAGFDTTQLSRVIASGDEATLFALLKSPVASKAVRDLHATALLDVTRKYSTTVVNTFLNTAGADKQKFLAGKSRHDYRTALHYAAHNGTAGLFTALYDHGGDLDARDYQNLTPRQVANYRTELLSIVHGVRMPRFDDFGSPEENEALLP
jgi:hypothetical protein